MKGIRGPTVFHVIKKWDHRVDRAVSFCGTKGTPEEVPEDADICETCQTIRDND
jgi:hypothetical protein